MGLVFRFLRWLWRRISDASTASDLLDFLDLKTALMAAASFVAMIFYGALNGAWSSQVVVLAAIAAAACVSVVFIALRLFLSPSAASPMVAMQEQERIPISAMRDLAASAGWCADVHAATVGDNDWWTFTTRLRQAAVDGDIDFWGKKYIYDYGKDLDAEPLVRIPREHFEEFGFDPTQVAQADNYNIFTGKLGDPPSGWKGSIFRDLHVDAGQARAWLNGKGAPPPAAEFVVKLNTAAAKIGDYSSICALTIQNISSKELERCLVQMEQFSGVAPEKMPMPLVLRTDGQIRNSRNGRFTLSAGQPKTLPIIFRDPVRKNEWYFFDETGNSYMVPAGPAKIVLGVYGGTMPGKVLVYVETDAGWAPYPSIKTVSDDYQIWQ